MSRNNDGGGGGKVGDGQQQLGLLGGDCDARMEPGGLLG